MKLLLRLAFLLSCLIGTAHAQPAGCTNMGCPGSALASGFLSVGTGALANQIVSGLGVPQRLACAEFLGKPNDGTMPAIRTAGFNCIRIDWRDAYLNSQGQPTFSDPFTSLSLHQNWQTGDKWGIGATFDNGIGQGGPFLGDFGSQWWVNPFNPNTAFASCGTNCYANGIYQISPSGTLELGLQTIPSSMQAYINTTSKCNNPTPCSGVGGVLNYLGGILNNQNTNTQQFGDYQLTVAVDQLPGFDFQWDIESFNDTTNTNNPPEIDTEIYTDASNVMHLVVQIDGGSLLYSVTSPTFNPAVPHNYELNWQSDFITFYVDGTQVGQVTTSSQPAVYSSGNPMFSYLLSAADYHSGVNPTLGSTPVYAHISAFNVYQTRAGAPVIANGLGCNTAADITSCVNNANTAGLKVVFSHRGNEVPTGTCNTFQANGLWFDSGLDSGGNDGCISGAGTVPFTQFESDTASLLGAYAGNSTVVGYEMHHKPVVNGVYTGTGSSGSGNFQISGGNLLAPNGTVFHAWGLNISDAQLNGDATLSRVQTLFPKLNYVRVNIGDGNCLDNQFNNCNVAFSTMEPILQQWLSANIVMMMDPHIGGGGQSGSSMNLYNEAKLQGRYAADLKQYPNLFIESGNELVPPLSIEHVNVYNAAHLAGAPWTPSTGYPNHAIKNNAGNLYIQTAGATDTSTANKCVSGSSGGPTTTGTGIGDGSCTWDFVSTYTASATGAFNGIIVFNTAGGNCFDCSGSPDVPAAYNSMSNVMWDQHWYNWMSCKLAGGNGSSNCSSFLSQMNNQTTVDGFVTQENTTGKNFTTTLSGPMPSGMFETGYIDYAGVCSGASGNTGTGSNSYNCGTGQIVTSALQGLTTGAVGGTIWLWYFSPCCALQSDIIVNGSNPAALTSFYGPDTQGLIAATSTGPFSSSGGGIPPINWGNGGPTDILLACEQVGAAVAAVNSGVIEFCPGPSNNTTTLLSGSPSPTGGGVGLSDLSNALGQPVTGLPAGKAAYSIDIYPTNLGGVSPDSPTSTVVPIWNTYFGNTEGSAPVLDMETGCSCDGTTGNLTDDNAMMTAWTAFANGTAAGGPTFTSSQQPMSNVWKSWGYFPAVNPDGTLNSDLLTLKTGQQTWWSTLLFGAAPPPPVTTTWNPNDQADITLTLNNTLAESVSTVISTVRSTTSHASGNVCFGVKADPTISANWDVGLANSTFSLMTAGGLGADANGIGFDPLSSGGKQGVFYNNVVLSAGTSTSANNENVMICANLSSDLFWATDSAMQLALGANSWNNSATCNPTVASCGLSFSGLTGPFFITFNTFEASDFALIETTAAQMPYSIPSGFVPWDNVTITGRAALMIMGANDNHPRPANDNGSTKVALNRRDHRR